MNEIQLARLANMARKTGTTSPTSPMRTPPISPTMERQIDNTGSLPNSESSYDEETAAAMNLMGPPAAEPEKRTLRKPPPLGSDLRERSLAMYKSINNMMAVGKSDLGMRRVPLPGARAVALDYAYHELYGTGALTLEDYDTIRKIVDDLVSKESLAKLLMSQEQVESQEKEERQHSTETSPNNNAEHSDSPLSPLSGRFHIKKSTDNSTPPEPITPDTQRTVDMFPVSYVDCVILRGQIKPRTDKLKMERRNYKYVNAELAVEGNSYASQGVRKSMEDQRLTIPYPNQLIGLEAPAQAYFGVYDGHSGKAAAEYARVHLHYNIFEEMQSLQWTEENLIGALRRGYLRTNAEFNAIATKNLVNAGTTSASVVMWSDRIFVANVGDSEVVICRNGVASVLSYSHTPGKPEEKERIEQLGGIVVAFGTWRVNGILSVSRSIGDNGLDKIVIADPAISVHERRSDDEFIIMATDGLWDVINYQDACDLVRNSLPQNGRDLAGRSLVEEAIRRKTNDNVTALVVFLTEAKA